MRYYLAAIAACLGLAGCNLTGAQTGALVCGLAADGATVVSIYRPGHAPKTGALAQVACDAGTQVGAVLDASKGVKK